MRDGPVRSHRLQDYRGLHAGETILVCGCGVSLNDLPLDPPGITIGVNDIGRRFDPSYLVVLNPPSQFRGGRFRHVAESRAQALFTQLELGIAHPRIVRFRLGEYAGTDLSGATALPYTRNSTYVALCLAIYMGAKRIGLIGVDFTDDHFFARTGPHPLGREIGTIDREFGALAAAARERGVQVVNLSPRSRITSLPKAPLSEFVAAQGTTRPDPGTESGETHMSTRVADLQDLSVAVERQGRGIVGDFLDALAHTAAGLGCRVVRDLRSVAMRGDVIKIVWNGRGYRGRGHTLFCEHGWLPRWSYQISPGGINASSHLAPFAWDGTALSEQHARSLALHLSRLRERGPGAYRYMQTQVEPAADTPSEYILVPLQMEWDTNIQRHVPARFRRMQALLDAVSQADPPVPVIYKQHPADMRRGNRQLRLRLGRKQDAIWPHERANIHALLKGGRCRGIVSLNSNVVHDGIIWGVPAVVLGRNLWPQGDDGPFLTQLPGDWSRLFGLWSDPHRRACRDAYAHYLMRHQWTREDASDPAKVRALLVPGRAAAPQARGQRVRRLGRPEAVKVNVVAANRGWFFEDLKRHFAAASGRRARVVVSERPVRDAGAWIFLRTREAVQTPRPDHTVVQIHDMFDEGLYRPGGDRRCVEACAGAVFTHPGQERIVLDSGIDLSGKLTLKRPIGALQGFSLRSRCSGPFTLAWVGRPVIHGGVELKRVDWVVDAASRLGRELRVILLGERLERQYARLRKAGIDCRYLHRRAYPIERYPAVYRGFDCVAIASQSEAGPMSLFEALATGVPVVSTPVGWAQAMIRDGRNGFIVQCAEEMVSAIERIRGARNEWFQRRAEIRRSLGGYRLEGWVDENLSLALQTLGERGGAGEPRPCRILAG